MKPVLTPNNTAKLFEIDPRWSWGDNNLILHLERDDNLHIYLLFNVITRICETEPKYCLMSNVNFLYLNRIIWLTGQASAKLVKYTRLLFPYCVVQLLRRDAHLKRVIKFHLLPFDTLWYSQKWNWIDWDFWIPLNSICNILNYSDTAENINAPCSLNDSAKHMTYWNRNLLSTLREIRTCYCLRSISFGVTPLIW